MKSRPKQSHSQLETMHNLTNYITAVLFILFASAFYLTISFTPLTKEEQMQSYQKMNDEIEPFRKNLSECARQVKATRIEVEGFLKRMPQSSMQGKCFVACILKRNSIILNNKVSKEHLLEANKAVYGEESEVMNRLKLAMNECIKVVEGIFEICEYASVFNDCMHIKMEHILDQVTLERRMQALGEMTSDPEQWGAEEDEIMQLVKDEL